MIKTHIKTLHLGVEIKGKKYIALFDELASYPTTELTKPIQNINEHRVAIFGAMDLIIRGY